MPRCEPGGHPDPVDVNRLRIDAAAPSHVRIGPELLEVLAKARGDPWIRDDRDHVLLTRPRVDRPVRGAGPDGLVVPDGVLVVHQVGDSRYRARVDGQLTEDLRAGSGRGVELGGSPRIDVVQEPRGDAACLGLAQLIGDDRSGRVREPKVIERQLEGRACGAQEIGYAPRDRLGRLAAVRQGYDFNCSQESLRWSAEFWRLVDPGEAAGPLSGIDVV